MNDIEKKITDVKTKNLSDGTGFKFGDVPIKKFYDQAQYIEKTLLPAVERKSGDRSADYQFFAETFKCLLYGAIVIDRNDMLIRKIQHLMQQIDILQVRVDISERELLKYTTLEDIMLTESNDKLSANIARKIENSIKEK